MSLKELRDFCHLQLKYAEQHKTGFGAGYDSEKTEQEFDLSLDEATEFGKQYSEGCVFFKGKWIESPNIKEIEIRKTEGKANSYGYFPQAIFTDSKFEIVTRRFIKSQPKKESVVGQPIRQSVKKETATQNKDVFIVHGTNHIPMTELKTMLFEFGLNPIVLHEKASGGSQTLIEKLEKYSNVNYAFVILTPDDIGGSVAGLEQALAQEGASFSSGQSIKTILEKSFRRRARQNVVLEFGYFIGKLERSRVCCLYQGNVELPSDMHGIMYIQFNTSIDEARFKIMQELKTAGYEIKI